MGGGGSPVHNNVTAWPNLGLLDSNKLRFHFGPECGNRPEGCFDNFSIKVNILNAAKRRGVFSCEATLDNTQNVTNSLTNSLTKGLFTYYVIYDLNRNGGKVAN